jgi:hypothetical protein
VPRRPPSTGCREPESQSGIRPAPSVDVRPFSTVSFSLVQLGLPGPSAGHIATTHKAGRSHDALTTSGKGPRRRAFLHRRPGQRTIVTAPTHLRVPIPELGDARAWGRLNLSRPTLSGRVGIAATRARSFCGMMMSRLSYMSVRCRALSISLRAVRSTATTSVPPSRAHRTI